MKISPFWRSAVSIGLPRSTTGGAPAPSSGPVDQVLTTKGLPPHARPLARIEDPHELMGLTPPALLRPVILVHGLAQHADTWVNLKNFLTNDPANVYGGVYSARDEGRFVDGLRQRPQARVFALDLSDNLASPADVAAELTRSIQLIRRHTGARQVDVVTHSMGALVAREAIRSGCNDIDHLVMVAPPNQGSYEADLSMAFKRVHSRYPADRLGAMDALRVEYSALGNVSNEYLHGLNEAWKIDSAKVDATIITGVGIPTPDRAWGRSSPGDGMVAAHRAPLGETPF